MAQRGVSNNCNVKFAALGKEISSLWTFNVATEGRVFNLYRCDGRNLNSSL